jgi:hypothetical protein
VSSFLCKRFSNGGRLLHSEICGGASRSTRCPPRSRGVHKGGGSPSRAFCPPTELLVYEVASRKMLSYLVWIVVFRAVGELHAQRSGLCDRSSRTARRVTLRRFCVTPLGEALLEGSERCHAGASSLIRLTPPPKNNPGRRAHTSRPKSVAGAAARRSAGLSRADARIPGQEADCPACGHGRGNRAIS